VVTRYQVCARCRKWQVDARCSDVGECRAHAPVWPITHHNDWCDEYEGPAASELVSKPKVERVALDSDAVDTLWWSTRVHWVFKREDIDTIGQLCRYRPGDLLGLENFGKISLRQVEEELALHGRHLAPDDAPKPERPPRPTMPPIEHVSPERMRQIADRTERMRVAMDSLARPPE
jgi:DNA-directed RNA polymerase alpha subunit